MLKLIYHTAVFGPIDLEYDRPVIRVGRSEDNDLVLRHPSVEPYHCLLAFRDEKILWLPPSQELPTPAELRGLTGPELGHGEQLWIGELQFSLAHSSKTVALPEVQSQGAMAGASAGAAGPRYYCMHCRAFVLEAEVKRVGLVGHAKRNLCPKCSRPLETELEPQKPPPGLAERLRKAARKLSPS